MERLTPSNIEAERATLGSCLMDRDAVIAIVGYLTPEHFYLEKHRWIYEAIVACYEQRTPPDLQTVCDALRRRNQLEIVGGMAFLVELTNSVPTAYHVDHYGRIVERTGLFRRLIQVGGKISALGYDEDRTFQEVYADASAAVANIAPAVDKERVQTMEQAVNHFWQRLEQGREPGYMSGFADLDRLLSGFHPGRLYVLAARPSVGKSTLSRQLAAYVASKGQQTRIQSLEMSNDEITIGLKSMWSGIDSQRIARYNPAIASGNTLNDEELTTLATAGSRLALLPLTLDDESALTIADLRTRALQHVIEHGSLGLLVVDYLQLTHGSGKYRGSNREQEVSEVARGLKNLARESKCAVIALSQLNREVDRRNDHIPTLADLRESGEIEQAADVVMFLHRPEMYDRDTDKKGVAELYVSKNRHGPLGAVSLFFDVRTGRFRDLAPYQQVEGY